LIVELKKKDYEEKLDEKYLLSMKEERKLLDKMKIIKIYY
jgi:c-di-GMP-related signal transduction protein